MGRDLAASLGLLWAHRALMATSLGCRMTIQRLCVLLLAFVRSRIEPHDIQAMVGEFDYMMHAERLQRLEDRALATGQLHRLHELGLLSRCEAPGFYALQARARFVLERALALERRISDAAVVLEEPVVGYSVRVKEFPGVPFDHEPLTHLSRL